MSMTICVSTRNCGAFAVKLGGFENSQLYTAVQRWLFSNPPSFTANAPQPRVLTQISIDIGSVLWSLGGVVYCLSLS